MVVRGNLIHHAWRTYASGVAEPNADGLEESDYFFADHHSFYQGRAGPRCSYFPKEIIAD